MVRVNDRGPFSNDRIIDMSAQAANMLGFYNQGTAEVQVDYVGRAPLDGDDTEMLLATYVGPGAGGDTGNTMIAYNQQTQEVQLATARRPFNPFSNGAAAAVFATAGACRPEPIRWRRPLAMPQPRRSRRSSRRSRTWRSPTAPRPRPPGML